MRFPELGEQVGHHQMVLLCCSSLLLKHLHIQLVQVLSLGLRGLLAAAVTALRALRGVIHSFLAELHGSLQLRVGLRESARGSCHVVCSLRPASVRRDGL